MKKNLSLTRSVLAAVAVAALACGIQKSQAESATFTPGGTGAIGTQDIGSAYTAAGETSTWNMDVDASASSTNCDTLTGFYLSPYMTPGSFWVININVIGTRAATGDTRYYQIYTNPGGTFTPVTPTINIVANSPLSDGVTAALVTTGPGNVTISVTYGESTGGGSTNAAPVVTSVVPAVGSATANFHGTAGASYNVKRATDVKFTTGVRSFSAVTADGGGVFSVTDDFSDLGAAPASAFYQVVP